MLRNSGVDERYDHPHKVYVKVYAQFNPDGSLTPLSFVWEDGTRYTVDKVLQVERAASLKAGGTGIRYTVRVCGKVTRMWLEVDRWFMERKQPN